MRSKSVYFQKNGIVGAGLMQLWMRSGATLVLTILLTAVGCVGTEQYLAAQNSGPFVTYTHETFIQKESGETGLFINGEDWYSLINLQGFKDTDTKFVSPYQFLFQTNNKGIRLSAFAEKLPGVKDSQSCLNYLNYYWPENYQKKLGSKTVGIMESGAITSIYYRPYFKGYCFDFHFSTVNQGGKDEISKIIDSIKFVDGSFSNVFIKKLIYYQDKRIQLLIPDSYNISYNGGTSGSIPSIVLRPKNGNKFRMDVTILTSKNGLPIPKEEIRRIAQLQMAKVAKVLVDEPKLLEITKEETTVYYYVAQALNKEDYLCQGFAAVNGSALYFTIVYHEAGQEISKQGLDIIANARILNL